MFQSQSTKGMFALAAMSLIAGTTATLETCSGSTPSAAQAPPKSHPAASTPQAVPSSRLNSGIPVHQPVLTTHGPSTDCGTPDNCDGTYEASCDSKRAYTNITAILQEQDLGTLVDYMDEYWVDINGDNEDFWSHEWSKHGTCINTIEPSCYSGYTPQQEVGDFFQTTVDLFKKLDTHKALAAAGITPSTSKTYTLAAIQAALTKLHGAKVYLGCSSSKLNEVWYFYNVKGNAIDGTYEAVGTLTTPSCPATGIKYVPK
ncbi:hypothetical protein N7517_000146 [Penicillium concentricum]|uniref:ribonuclease T2 n=1 Tax=Penicillium concentricum TaxID=293559 RepID=A0A9W9SPK2_9EURO|nr:uncharacterized protein N7517_000146 [Penicillium concentricum]KAJ5382235.1 hypothetical protein N7517_000146 [Penicillium concentricum]